MEKKQNLELKHYCDDFPAIRNILKDLGAAKEAEKDQVDYFFDLPERKQAQKARLKLRVEGERMTLVYYERPDFANNTDTEADIRLLPADETMKSFLELSLGVTGVVAKRREMWRKDHTVFHLDEVADVGQIFEIELQKDGEITDEDRTFFTYYQSTISPYLGDVITGSNIDLVLKRKQELA